MKTLTEKQIKAWQQKSVYIGADYELTFENGTIKGYFTAYNGEYTQKVNIKYNPIEALCADPLQESEDLAHGWLVMGGGDSWSSEEIPHFQHPNDLYQWLREAHGYPTTII